MEQITWGVVGPILLTVIGAICTALSVVLWALLQSGLRDVKRLTTELAALRENLPKDYASIAALNRVEQRVMGELRDISFHMERHIEHSTALWTSKEPD